MGKDLETNNYPTFDQFKKSNFGRPTKYNEHMAERLFKYYFEFQQDGYPTLEGFLTHECIGVTTFRRWLEAYPDFRATYEFCKTKNKDTLIQAALSGKIKAHVINLIAVNYTDFKIDLKSKEMPISSVEKVPARQKGYDISKIDQYC